jgi:glycerophosphoryl diester phosphodiesterase
MLKIGKKYDIYVIAHRGASAECPDNSIEGFTRAAEVGADFIEFDVHLNNDDEILVFHGNPVKAVLNSKETYDKEERIKQNIPLIDDLFKKLKGKIHFQIEIKPNGVADRLVEKINEYNLNDSVLISSFKLSELSRIKELDSSIPCCAIFPSIPGWIYQGFTKKSMVKKTISKGFDGFHPYYKHVNKDLIDYAHSKSLIVNPWTTDDPIVWKKLIDDGVDGIISNDPRKLINFLNNN